MALIECLDCHNKISSLAEICIYCGRPINTKKTKHDNVREVYVVNNKKGEITIIAGWIMMLFTFIYLIGKSDFSLSPLYGLVFAIGLVFVVVGSMIKWWHNL